MDYFVNFLSLSTTSLRVTVAVVALMCFLWYWFAYRPYQFFKRRGIPHPPVVPLFGNAAQITREGRLASYEKWIKKYGKVCGYYVGATPHFLITDLDMVKDIMVKHSEIFMDRLFEGESLMEVLHFQLGLITLNGEPWKRARRIISPAFSVSKVKQMIPFVESCCDNLLQRFMDIAKSGQTVDIAKLYGQFAMSTVISSAFGREVNILKGEADILTDAACELVTGYNERIPSLAITTALISHVPFLEPFFQFLIKHTRAAVLTKTIRDSMLHLVQARRQQESKYKDFLQLVIEAYDEEDKNSPNGEKILHDDEIVGQCIELLFAGYETTGNNLGFMAYLLANNPDKQEKLHQAIDEYYQENEDATLHEASEAIPYLDWVCQEALRLYAGVPRFSRFCRETVDVKGVTIPKGYVVSIGIQFIHDSAEHWEDPEMFRPERFNPEEKEGRHAMSYLPFGVGPRHCIATKFAIMEVKMAVLTVMRHTKFVTAPETKVPKVYAIVTQGAINGIHLKIQTR